MENHLGNLYVPKEKVQDLINYRANVKTAVYDGKEEVLSQYLFKKRKCGSRFTYYCLYEYGNYHWFDNGELISNLCGLKFLECANGCLVVSKITSWGCNFLYDLIKLGIVKQFGRND